MRAKIIIAILLVVFYFGIVTIISPSLGNEMALKQFSNSEFSYAYLDVFVLFKAYAPFFLLGIIVLMFSEEIKQFFEKIIKGVVNDE